MVKIFFEQENIIKTYPFEVSYQGETYTGVLEISRLDVNGTYEEDAEITFYEDIDPVTEAELFRKILDCFIKESEKEVVC